MSPTFMLPPLHPPLHPPEHCYGQRNEQSDEDYDDHDDAAGSDLKYGDYGEHFIEWFIDKGPDVDKIDRQR